MTLMLFHKNIQVRKKSLIQDLTSIQVAIQDEISGNGNLTWLGAESIQAVRAETKKLSNLVRRAEKSMIMGGNIEDSLQSLRSAQRALEVGINQRLGVEDLNVVSNHLSKGVAVLEEDGSGTEYSDGGYGLIVPSAIGFLFLLLCLIGSLLLRDKVVPPFLQQIFTTAAAFLLGAAAEMGYS